MSVAAQASHAVAGAVGKYGLDPGTVASLHPAATPHLSLDAAHPQGQTQTVRGSWFGGPNDPMAGGAPAGQRGYSGGIIAVYDPHTLNGYYRVQAPNGQVAVLRHGDIGPHPSTGRGVDISYNALGQLGYTERNFPTDGHFKITYLGRSPGNQPAPQSQPAGQAQQQGQPQQPLAALNAFLSSKSAFTQDGPKTGLGTLPWPTYSTPGTPALGQGRQAQAPQQTANGGGYVHPFAGAQVTPSRIDQGVDYGVNGPIRAIGNATVKAILNYQGFGTYLVYQLHDGPHAGNLVYVSEHISPTVRQGQQVRAGDVIAHGSGGIETGWAQPGNGYLPAAKVTGGYSEGQLTSAGQSFDQLMRSLGAPAGTRGGRSTVGNYR